MGRGGRAETPDLDGVLIVDKPTGMTSHDVVQVVRRAAGQRRVGHTGTLDPDATGVLVVCLGRATRLVQHLQAGRKTYAATMVLGRETSSQDADGEIVAEADASGIDEQQLCVSLTRFQGDIQQIPPMVSAVKVDGERLHAKARRGEVVEREPRNVTIHDLVLEDFTPGEKAEASFLVTCSAGTYVRTLAHDVGADLGVGGSLTALRRIANGPFTVDAAATLDAVREAGESGRLAELLLSPYEAVAAMPQHAVTDDEVLDLTHGKRSPARGEDGTYAIVWRHRLVGIYHDEGDRSRSDLVMLRPEDVAAVLSEDAHPGLAAAPSDGAADAPDGSSP